MDKHTHQPIRGLDLIHFISHRSFSSDIIQTHHGLGNREDIPGRLGAATPASVAQSAPPIAII
jgi:hypothetical protein